MSLEKGRVGSSFMDLFRNGGTVLGEYKNVYGKEEQMSRHHWRARQVVEGTMC